MLNSPPGAIPSGKQNDGNPSAGSVTANRLLALPNRASVRNLDALAWLGDARLEADIRYTCVARTGAVGGVWADKLGSGRMMRDHLIKVGYAVPDSLSTHLAGQCFEYLYYTDSKFRATYMREHNLIGFQTTPPVADSSAPANEPTGRCWTKLFVGPVTHHDSWVNYQYLGKSQLNTLSLTNKLSDRRFDIIENGLHDWHLVYGNTYTAREVIESMRNKTKLGALRIVGGPADPSELSPVYDRTEMDAAMAIYDATWPSDPSQFEWIDYDEDVRFQEEVDREAAASDESVYYAEPGYCYFNGFTADVHSWLRSQLSSQPLLWKALGSWDLDCAGTGSYALQHTTVGGDPTRIAIHVDRIRGRSDLRPKCRARNFYEDVARYVRLQGLWLCTESRGFSLTIGGYVISNPTYPLHVGRSVFDVPRGRLVDMKLTRRSGKLVLLPMKFGKCSQCELEGTYNISRGTGRVLLTVFRDQLYCTKCKEVAVESFEDERELASRLCCSYVYCELEHGDAGCRYLRQPTPVLASTPSFRVVQPKQRKKKTLKPSSISVPSSAPVTSSYVPAFAAPPLPMLFDKDSEPVDVDPFFTAEYSTTVVRPRASFRAPGVFGDFVPPLQSSYGCHYPAAVHSDPVVLLDVSSSSVSDETDQSDDGISVSSASTLEDDDFVPFNPVDWRTCGCTLPCLCDLVGVADVLDRAGEPMDSLRPSSGGGSYLMPAKEPLSLLPEKGLSPSPSKPCGCTMPCLCDLSSSDFAPTFNSKGYCYLKLFKPHKRSMAAATLKANPLLKTLLHYEAWMHGYLDSYRIVYNGVIAHVTQDRTPVKGRWAALRSRRFADTREIRVGNVETFNEPASPRDCILARMKTRELEDLAVIIQSGEFKEAFRSYQWSNTLMNGRYGNSDAWVVAESHDWEAVWHPDTVTLWSKSLAPYVDVSLPFDYSTSPLTCRSIPYHDHRWVGPKGYIVKKKGECLRPEETGIDTRWAAGLSKYKGSPTCGHSGEGYAFNGKVTCYTCGIAKVGPMPWQKLFPAWADLTSCGDYETLVGLFNELKPANIDVWDFKDDGIWFHDVLMTSSHAVLQTSYMPSQDRLSFVIRLRSSSHLVNGIRFPFPVWSSPAQLPGPNLAGVCFYTDKRPRAIRIAPYTYVTRAMFTTGSPYETLTGLSFDTVTFKTYSQGEPEETCWAMDRTSRTTYRGAYCTWWDKFATVTYNSFDRSTEQSIDPIVYEAGQVLATRQERLSSEGFEKSVKYAATQTEKYLVPRPVNPPFLGSSLEFAKYLASYAALPRSGKAVVHNRSSLQSGAPALWRGLPYYKMGASRESLDNCYRGDEQSLFRKPCFRGLYNTAFPVVLRPADTELRSYVQTVVDFISTKANGRKVLISASPDGPPPPGGLGWVPMAFNTTRADWFKIPCQLVSGHPREWAFWRLAALYAGVDVWIVNGREVESHVTPRPYGLRVSSWNAGTASPLLLSSAYVPNGTPIPPLESFTGMLQYASTYGADEVFLMKCPLTVSLPFTVTRHSCWALPQDYSYPNCQIYEKGTLVHEGEWGRVAAAKYLAFQEKPPVGLPQSNSLFEEKRIDELWDMKRPLQYVDNPLNDVPGKRDMLLIVTFGTRGDVEPVEALAQLIQAMGVPLRVWRARDVSSLELFRLDEGKIAHLIPAFMRMWAVGGTGWKCVMLPHTPTFGPHILYDMTPWKEMRSYKAPMTFLGQAAARLAELKGAHLVIGASPGCNTLAFQNGKPLRKTNLGLPRTRKYIVLGSGGANEAEHQYLEDPEWEVHENPHHYDAFQDAAEVRCPGGQGIMRVLQANAVPVVHVSWPSKDRDYKYDCNQGSTYQACGIEALEDELCAHGFINPKTPFQKWASSVRTAVWPLISAALIAVVWTVAAKHPPWVSRAIYVCYGFFISLILAVAARDRYIRKGLIDGFTKPFARPWYEWLRALLFFLTLWPVIVNFSFYMATFPELLVLRKTWMALVPGLVAKTLFRWPILMQYGGVYSVGFFYAAFWVARQFALGYLAADRQTYLRIRFAKSWMFMRHVLFTDKRINESVEMRWRGYANLKAPFEGVVVKNDTHHHPYELWIPVPINYASVKAQTLASGGRYGPNFNCQTEAVRVSKDPTTTIVVVLFQLYAYPIVTVAYWVWKLTVQYKPHLGDRPVSSFFRFATEEEYAEVENLLEEREKQAEQWRAELFADDEANERLRRAAALKAVIVLEEDGSEKVLTETEALATFVPSDYDLQQLQETKELATHEANVNFIADLVAEKISEGVVEEEAYHLGVRALRKQVLLYEQPEEVLTWVEKYSPRLQTTFDQVVTALGDFLRYHTGSAVLPFRAVQTLYQWIEGIGAKAKTMVMRLWEAFDYVATVISLASHAAWELFSIAGRAFMDWAFDGKLNLRYKSVWALGGVARNPKMAAQKRMLESIAYHSYVRKGFFEKEYKAICDNLTSLLPEASVPAQSPKRDFLSPQEGGSKNKPFQTLKAPSHVAIGGQQFRSVGIPRKPVVNEYEALALQENGWTGRLLVDAERSAQVSRMLEKGVKQCLDGAYKVHVNPHVMSDMSARYAYYGLELDPSKEMIPPVLSDQQMMEADSVACAMAEAYPEAYKDMKYTHEHAMMRYYEWQRRIGSPWERHYRLRWEAWRAGVGYQVLKDVVRERTTGQVSKAQYGSFVKSQEVPKDKKPRGVTFMTIERWFKGQCEEFERNSRVVWKLTGTGKNMPLNQNMADIFRTVASMENKFEADNTEADSRFEGFVQELISRLAYYGWNDERLASIKRAMTEAGMNGWIFNLHMNKGDHVPRWMKPPMEHPNAAKYSNVSDKRRGGATGDFDTSKFNTDAILGSYCGALTSYLHGKGVTSFSHSDFFAKETVTLPLKVTLSIAELADQKATTGSTQPWKMATHEVVKAKYIEFSNTGDDNMQGINFERIIDDFAPSLKGTKFLADEFAKHCGDNYNMDVTIIQHDEENGRWNEYLSKYCRPATVHDRRVVNRVEEIYKEQGIFGPSDRILDPTTNLPVSEVVYQNLLSPMSKQTALKAYKEQAYRDRFLHALIERDAGHMALCAFVPDFYMQCSSTIHHNMVRYLAAAAFPKTCRDHQGLPVSPQGEEREFILRHIKTLFEDVGQRMPYFVVDGNLRRDRKFDHIPEEFVVRLKTLRKLYVPRYSKVVFDHFVVAHKTPEYHERLMAKLNKGLYGVDEGAKMLLDSARSWMEAFPRKLSRGVVATLEMVYPDEIWNGSGRVEAFAMLSEELASPPGVVVSADSFQRRVNQSPYAGCCNAPKAFWFYSTPEGRAELHKHPRFVYQNACTWISIHYAFMWYVERWVLSLPFVGLAYALMMFYMVDVTKIYAVIGLLFWHHACAASLVISGLMPRDIYVWSKRFSDWSCGYIPLELGYVLRTDLLSGWIATVVEWIAEFLQHATHLTPKTSSGVGTFQNEWIPVANEAYLTLYSLPVKALSIKGPTGTGKSSFFIYALMRMNDLERGGDLWLVAPTEVLRDDWSLPSFFAIGNHDTTLSERTSQYQVLRKGVMKRTNARIFLCTYGHFSQRLLANQVGSNDIVCFDESHQGSGAMVQSDALLKEKGIWLVYLSATPAPVKGIDFGPMIDSSYAVNKKWRTKTVTFPASTNVVAMYQQARASPDVDKIIGHSHKELTERCIISVPTLKAVTETIAGLEELRKSDSTIPPTIEFTSSTAKHNKKEREEVLATGKYIMVCTEGIMRAGYDVKPAAYMVVDSGLGIQQHEGQLLPPAPTTAIMMEQLHGRTGRNSSDRHGLVYCTDLAGTGDTALTYPSGSLFAEKSVAKAFDFPQLKELPYKGDEKWNHFAIRTDVDYDPVIRDALRFVFLAAMSGVMPRDMKSFYAWHAQEGRTLPDHHEWMSQQLSRSAFGRRYPSWDLVLAAMETNPFILNTKKVIGGKRAVDQLVYASVVYPVARNWTPFSVVSNSQRSINFRGSLSDEAKAYDELVLRLEDQVARLKAKLATSVQRQRAGLATEQFAVTANRNVLARAEEELDTVRTHKAVIDNVLHETDSQNKNEIRARLGELGHQLISNDQGLKGKGQRILRKLKDKDAQRKRNVIRTRLGLDPTAPAFDPDALEEFMPTEPSKTFLLQAQKTPAFQQAIAEGRQWSCAISTKTGLYRLTFS